MLADSGIKASRFTYFVYRSATWDRIDYLAMLKLQSLLDEITRYVRLQNEISQIRLNEGLMHNALIDKPGRCRANLISLL